MSGWRAWQSVVGTCPHTSASSPASLVSPGSVLLLLWPHWIDEKLLRTSLPSVHVGPAE